jgi:pyrimidine-nucleoside phosphorylase/thymidine phosphorylase
MDVPLGRAVGNSLEIIECADLLKGTGPSDLAGVVRALGIRMVLVGGLEHDEGAASRRVEAALSSGRALEVFKMMIERHGGDPRAVDDYSLMPVATDCHQVKAPRAGYLTAMKAEAIGRAAHALGAGRSRAGEGIDHGVGIVVRAKPGDDVREGDTLLDVYHRGGRNLESALAHCTEAISIGAEPPAAVEKVLGEVR